jgi:hypothetical protein
MLFQKNADGWNILVASPLPRCLVFRFVTGLVFIKFFCFAEFADIDVVLPFAVLRGIHLSTTIACLATWNLIISNPSFRSLSPVVRFYQHSALRASLWGLL